MGQPVAGNPTQYMMQKAFQLAGLDWCYLTFEVAPEYLGDAMRGFRAFEFRGGNITIPHNRAAVEYVDELTDSARLCGAINCVTRTDDRLVGDNTIGRGFLQSLGAAIEPAEKRIVLLGAGGAARAIGIELARAGAASIVVVNRTESHGRELIDLINGIDDKTKSEAELAAWEGDFRVAADTDLLIHATSICMNDPDAMPPVDLESLRPECTVVDVIFNPPQSRFLDAAAERKCNTLDGLDMLVNQCVIAFENWTGVAPDAITMREAVEEFLSV